MPDVTTLFNGRFLRIVKQGTWEYAERQKVTGVVAIVPVTDDGEFLFVEQMRIPVGKRVIEFPAGLAGDVAGAESEPLLEAARRELLEETGYSGGQWSELETCPTSSGLTSETVTFFRAVGLQQTGTGEGDGHEQITLHRVPVSEVDAWLGRMSANGFLIAALVHAGLYLAGFARSID